MKVANPHQRSRRAILFVHCSRDEAAEAVACVAEGPDSEARSRAPYAALALPGNLDHICAAAEFCGRCTIPAVEFPAAGPPPPARGRRPGAAAGPPLGKPPREAQERGAALRAYAHLASAPLA